MPPSRKTSRPFLDRERLSHPNPICSFPPCAAEKHLDEENFSLFTPKLGVNRVKRGGKMQYIPLKEDPGSIWDLCNNKKTDAQLREYMRALGPRSEP